MSDAPSCPWCGNPFTAAERRHGSPQRFCSAQCRLACAAAARRWGMLQFEAGRVSAAELRAVTRRTGESEHASNAGPMSEAARRHIAPSEACSLVLSDPGHKSDIPEQIRSSRPIEPLIR